MSVSLDADTIHLQGDCRVEDAEPLLTLLQTAPHRTVDLRAVTHLHAAVVQVLLAMRPAMVGSAADPFVRIWLAPLLARPSSA
jgi:hypothetical protein